MKKLILTLTLLFSVGVSSVNAEVKNDTIPVNNAGITKVVDDETVNSKGEKTIRFYFFYEGDLIPTSRSVVEKYNLCKKHGAKCALAMVISKKTKRKRIILN